MAVSVLNDLYDNLKKNNSSAQKSTSAAKATTTPVSTKKTTTVSSNSGKTTTTTKTSNSLINTIKNFFSGLNQKASASMSNYNPNSGVYTSSAGSYSNNPNTSTYSNVAKQTVKAYDQPFTSSGTNYTTVPKANTTVQKAYNEPFVATQIPKNTVSGTISLNELAQKTKNAYNNSAYKQITDAASNLGNNIRNQIAQVTGLDKVDQAYKNMKQQAADTVTNAMNYVAENSKKLDPIQQQRLDATFAGKIETDSVVAKIKADPNYANKLMDAEGKMIDYSSEIDRLKGQLQTTYDSTQRKAIREQLTQLQEYQADQNKLWWSSYYDYLVRNGASEEDLNEFKKAVNKSDWNWIERTIGHFTSTVESYLGNTLKGYETLYKKAAEYFGVDYKYSDLADVIINDAAEMAYYADLGASGTEKFIHEVYGSSSNYLYALASSIFTGNALGLVDAANLAGNAAAMSTVNSMALLQSDVSVLGSQAKQNLDNGYDFDTAVNNAMLHACLNHITESIGGESLANIITGRVGDELFKNTVKYAIKASANQFFSEAIEEGMEAVASPIIDKLTLNTGLTVESYLNQVFSKDTAYQMLMGGIGGLAMGAGATGMTVYEVTQNVNTIADTIDIKSKKDYNAALEAQNKLQEIVNNAQRNVQSEADQDQIFTTQMLLKAFNNKITEYKVNHPYMDAIKSGNDIPDVDMSGNADLFIAGAASPEISNNLHEIADIKAATDEQNQKAIEMMQQRLSEQGINISAVDWSNLSEEAMSNVQMVNDYAKSLGRNVAFANVVSRSGEVIDGFYDNESGQIVVNPNGQRAALSTLIHEFTHGTETSQYYDQLHDFVRMYLGDTYEANLQHIKDEYSTVQNLTDEGAARELTAITAQELLADPDFVDRLVRYNTSLAYRMYEEIRYANSQIGILSGIEQNFMRAFADYDAQMKNDQGVQLSIGVDQDGIGIFDIDEMNDVLNQYEGSSIYSKLAKYLKEKYSGRLIDIGGIYDAIFNNTTAREYAYPSNELAPEAKNAKVQAASDLDLILRNAVPIDFGVDKKNVGKTFDHFKTTFGVRNGNEVAYYDAVVNAKVYPDNRVRFYDLTQINEKNRSLNSRITAIPPVSNSNISDISDEVKNEMVELSKGTQLEDLGRQKDLLAIHNLSENNLLKSIDLGGFAVPSIAVTKDTINHDNYGNISLVFDKNTIDPSKKGNKVYGGDAWTGTYPSVDYEADLDSVENIREYLESIYPDWKALREIDSSSNSTVYKMTDKSLMSDFLDSRGGDITKDALDSKALQYLFLTEKGQAFDVPFATEPIFDLGSQEADERLLNGIIAAGFKPNEYGLESKDIVEFIEPIRQLVNEYYAEKYPEVVKKRGEFYSQDDFGFADADKYLRKANSYLLTGQTKQKFDRQSFDSMLLNAKENYNGNFDNDYTAWINNLLSQVKYKTGIRNDKDMYTNSGARRSFDSLHDPYTLENIFKFMKKQAGSDSRGKHEGVFGVGAGDIQATQKIDFKNLQDIISHEDMLVDLSEQEVEEIIKPTMNRINNVSNEIAELFGKNSRKFANSGDQFESDMRRYQNAKEFVKDTIQKNTKDQMIGVYQREYAQYPSLQLSDEDLNHALDLVIGLKDELRNMPTRYFEAKPVRIVGLNEVQAAVIPSTASDLLKQRLADHGINTVEYDPSVKGDRTAKISSLDNLKFSKGVTLEDLNNQARREFRNLDLASRRVNLKEDINSAIDDIVYNGEVSEASYNALRQDVIRSTMQQMDNPAWEVARDIRRTLGNNFGTLPRDGWDAIIADINDQYNLFDENYRTYNTYEDAQEFIKDYLSRAGEKYIYMSPVDTGDISEEEYEAKIDQKLDQVITMLKEGVANRINQTAIDNTLADALGLKDDSLYYQEMEDLAYQRGQQDLDALMNEDEKFLKAYEEATAGNYSPEALQQLEDDMVSGITIDQAKEETSVLKEVKKDTSKPLKSWKDKGIWYQLRQKIFDKGIAIRDLKNSKLSASYDMLLNAENRANYTILEGCYDENGHKVVDSLTEISKMIPEAQKNDFDYYMYHKHNIDAAKIGKPVFFNFDAAKSQQIVNQYEMAHPEWREVAQKYYDFNNYLLKRQVDAGVISQQTADLWKQLYPHYVPTKRALETVDDANVVETADPQVQSANKGTLYERTGGNSPIQPLDYAMAEHAKQIYKSSLFNNFAKDYVDVSHAAATLFNEDHSFDEDIIEGKEEQVTKADEYTPATLIWYDNGDRMIVEIPQQIYDAIGPTQTPFNLPSNVPFLSWASSMRRNMITGANPVFWATNGLKDLQDIAFNSKYSLSTYMNLPRAYKQLLTNGEIANLYKSLGGDYNSYRSEDGIDQNEHSAFYNATIGKIVKLNDLIETAPRLAEFMSSLDHGDSLETAMYNAAEVTTNFKRGGDYAKWLNRNGATFLNASIQGFDKQVRNIADVYDSKGWKGVAGYMAKANLLAGIPLIVINGLLHRDDKDYDQLSDYVKDNYYILWKYDDGKFVRIPKGRIANAYQGILTALYENGVELVGDDKAIDKAKTIWENTLESLKNVWEQVGINDVGGNNIFSPIMQTIKNEAWYGDPIVNTYMQKKDPADQYDESTDLFSVWLGQKTNLSPKKINYLIDQYSGGVGDVILPMLTPKAETGLDDGTVVGKLTSAIASPFADKFTTDSVFKNQDVTDFFALDEELTKLANKEHASDEAKLASKYINSLQYQMNDLYAQKRQIYNDNSIPDSLKYEKAREVQRQIDALARFGLDTYDQIDMDGYYADLNGVSYYRNTKGEWSKVDQDKEAELDALNLTTKEKSDYFYVRNNISELREQVKADTPDGQDADYRAVTLDAIMNSDLTPRVQNLMYDSYYSGKITDNINGMDLTDEEKLTLKMANATASSVKDANGKTISNSKALGIADAYADAGLLDDVFSYIAANGLAPSDFGLTKTVYGYSYDKMASEYQKIYGETFGTGSAQNVDLSAINNKTSNSSSKKKTSYSKKRSGSSRSSRSSSSSKAQKAAEKARKKQIKALQKAAKALRKSNNNIFDLLYKMTSIKDTEANVKKIMQNAYKG